MTDLTAVKRETAVLMGCDTAELDKYESLINSCIASVDNRLADTADGDDLRVIHLIAAKCLCRILLIDQSENITSFKAGDVSYAVSSAAVDGAKELYSQALRDCAGLLSDEAFAFKAV